MATDIIAPTRALIPASRIPTPAVLLRNVFNWEEASPSWCDPAEAPPRMPVPVR
jgi:hypothetical protein